jgi:hypothetical protein
MTGDYFLGGKNNLFWTKKMALSAQKMELFLISNEHEKLWGKTYRSVPPGPQGG